MRDIILYFFHITRLCLDIYKSSNYNGYVTVTDFREKRNFRNSKFKIKSIFNLPPQTESVFLSTSRQLSSWQILDLLGYHCSLYPLEHSIWGKILKDAFERHHDVKGIFTFVEWKEDLYPRYTHDDRRLNDKIFSIVSRIFQKKKWNTSSQHENAI